MILVDLNVLLDVVQRRQPHYRASATVLEEVIAGNETGMLAAHFVTTLHYIVGRYASRKDAERVVDWCLNHFGIAPVGHQELLSARSLGWPDFEDAVVAAAARTSGCTAIVTRNVKDFAHSPIAALTPEEYLAGLDASHSEATP